MHLETHAGSDLSTIATPGSPARSTSERISTASNVYIACKGKHLVDLDEETLNVAQARLGTTTIKDTVNTALRRASEDRDAEVAAALDVLGRANLIDCAEVWR